MTSVFFLLAKSHRNAGGPLIQCVYHHQFQERVSSSGNVRMISIARANFASITWPSGLLML